jgi:hypothetical protein
MGLALPDTVLDNSRRIISKSKEAARRGLISDDLTPMPAGSLKEQFSKGSEAWKEQSDLIFRFSTEGDWWASPTSASAPAGISATKGRCVSIGPLEPSLSLRRECLMEAVPQFSPVGIHRGRFARQALF